ncbi:UNKNOWN [Stylonychia lemnae]|uniref:Uncharacterized protein n=1 Tax=Stylonychia lemnae TaxID=5949 RepID=A0A078B6M2_STYLE|nr:UNKNOWN [Stylonychia lemnae]|eukprot:CDW90185.1 UNKNOWN [Stylonychia lemnae]
MLDYNEGLELIDDTYRSRNNEFDINSQDLYLTSRKLTTDDDDLYQEEQEGDYDSYCEEEDCNNNTIFEEVDSSKAQLIHKDYGYTMYAQFRQANQNDLIGAPVIVSSYASGIKRFLNESFKIHQTQIKKVFENKQDHKNNKNRIKTALIQDKFTDQYKGIYLPDNPILRQFAQNSESNKKCLQLPSKNQSPFANDLANLNSIKSPQAYKMNEYVSPYKVSSPNRIKFNYENQDIIIGADQKLRKNQRGMLLQSSYFPFIYNMPIKTIYTQDKLKQYLEQSMQIDPDIMKANDKLILPLRHDSNYSRKYQLMGNLPNLEQNQSYDKSKKIIETNDLYKGPTNQPEICPKKLKEILRNQLKTRTSTAMRHSHEPTIGKHFKPAMKTRGQLLYKNSRLRKLKYLQYGESFSFNQSPNNRNQATEPTSPNQSMHEVSINIKQDAHNQKIVYDFKNAQFSTKINRDRMSALQHSRLKHKNSVDDSLKINQSVMIQPKIDNILSDYDEYEKQQIRQICIDYKIKRQLNLESLANKRLKFNVTKYI